MFTRILLTQLLLFVFILTNAQHKSSLGLIVSLDDQNVISGTNTFTSVSSSTFKTKYNYRLGFDYSKRRKRQNQFFKIGLRLVSIRLASDVMSDLRYPGEVNEMGEFEPDPSLPREIQIFNQVYFLATPIMLRFESNPDKINFFFETGISTHWYLLTRRKIVSDLGSATNSFRQEFRNINGAIQLVAVASTGINYDLSDKFQLFGQPTVRFHIGTQPFTGFDDVFYSFGLELGVRRKFY